MLTSQSRAVEVYNLQQRRAAAAARAAVGHQLMQKAQEKKAFDRVDEPQ